MIVRNNQYTTSYFAHSEDSKFKIFTNKSKFKEKSKFSLLFLSYKTIHKTKMIATTEKKIAIRKAPVEKAGTYDEGYVAKGTDDIDYVVVADKKGIKRWMKVKKENVASEEPPTTEEKPKRIYKKKAKEEEQPQPPVEEEKPTVEEPPKPKRTYKKKAKVEVEPPVQPDNTQVVEVPEPKVKRAYKKKPVFMEQGTQTDDVVCTPPKIKKERKIPDTPRK